MHASRSPSLRASGSSLVRRPRAAAALALAALGLLLPACEFMEASFANPPKETAPLPSFATATPSSGPSSGPSSAPSSAPTSVAEVKPAEPPTPEPPKIIRDGFAYLKDGVKISVDGDDKAEADPDSVTIRGVRFRINTTEHHPDVAKMKAELAKSGTKVTLTQVSVVAFDGDKGALLSFVAPGKQPKAAVEMLKMIGDKSFRCAVKIEGDDKDKSFRTSATRICKSLVAAE